MIDNLQAMIAALRGQPPEGDVAPMPRVPYDNNTMIPGMSDPTSYRPEVMRVNGTMPFPDNKDHRTDFVNRFPAYLPPAGIMNDLRPQVPEVPLQRKLNWQ